MTNIQKQEITALIKREILNLGSANKVAQKCNVSPALISQMLNNNEPKGWHIVETLNYRFITTVITDAKENSLFMAISHKAGSGKSATVKHYIEETRGRGIYYMRCRDWGKRDMLRALFTRLGLSDSKAKNNESMTNEVIRFFQERYEEKPLLVIDEADKLKPAALRFYITLFNECEDRLGVVFLGTENLEKEIKKGVRLSKKGYDEIDSRFGRNFIHLRGASFQDVKRICTANGVYDDKLIKGIFDECKPTITTLNGQTMKVVEDLRRLKRIVIREKLKMKLQNQSHGNFS